jgi:hypothetical protein
VIDRAEAFGEEINKLVAYLGLIESRSSAGTNRTHT